MKLLKLATTTILATFISGTAIAEDANPAEMATTVGFVGCDTLILNTFEYAMKSLDRRLTIDYFRETANTNVDFTVTFGTTGDTVTQNVHFSKNGGYCYSTVRTIISEVGNCAAFLSKDEFFKYTNDSAGALWSKNNGGVGKLFIQSGNSCSQIYMSSSKAKATR